MAERFIPRVDDFDGDVVRQRFDDMVNPPGLTNGLGAAQVDHDVTGVRSVNVPPFSHGDTVTGVLSVDGRLFRSFGEPVSTRWRPDRVLRWARLGDLSITTVTAMPPDTQGVVMAVEVTNTSDRPRNVRLGLSAASTVTRSTGGWTQPVPPSEPNTLTPADGRAALVGRARAGSAVSVQGVDVPGARVLDRTVEVTADVAAGETYRFGYVHVIDGDEAAALAAFDEAAADVPGRIDATRAWWNATLEAAFTPGNDRFSGHVPVLETSNDAVRRLYWWGVLGVIWFRRDNPASVLGRVYDTLTPRYWQTTTFIWDFSLSSMVHAQLDPEPMRRQLEHWIALDIHRHFGTEWLTGGPAGYWYSVNDYAMTRLVRDYVRWNGRRDFLDVELAASDGPRRPVAEHLRDWATAWESFRGAHALADYGEIDNLLECVSSYVHEVASLNAANVWCMRAAADVAGFRGRTAEAADLRARADELLTQVRELYVDGGGYWNARQPDGRMVPVRHCYDFATVGTTIGRDLPERERAEMVAFFVRELQTPSWMRALSPYDDDASFSLRPDHQWNGAYPAWPADAARALIQLGRADVVAGWLPGLARTANQGPPGQAHFVEEAAEPVNGGAAKAPPQYPYLIDWACSSAGSWAALVVEGLFGVDVALDGTVTAAPQLDGVDPEARLRNLRVGDRLVDVDADGVVSDGVS
ncbi:hypothetical protein CLV30_112118 [Haloactinopolyspora alba]|uniref:Alpha-L-rhamnosidase six-hairpin glycosidase domain-containing protein n=1 Tax=Haloactinopolyspora alba TaxID=648780 RepID=A0A2P8DXC5_9ACTN|nr:hypothetical protein [Haloactinopolyspora alba]PSL01879.1 hypothetical protein CLV30_112118 [Haloactinopolyspora alba]